MREILVHLRRELVCWRTIGYLAWMVIMAASLVVFCAAIASIGGGQ